MWFVLMDRISSGRGACCIESMPIAELPGDLGFALLGESLSLAWPRESNQREGHPDIRTRRPRFASQNSPPSGAAPGAVAKGRPCPFTPRSASCLASPCATPTLRPPDGGVSPRCLTDREAWFVVCDRLKTIRRLQSPLQEGERSRRGEGRAAWMPREP